MIAFVELVLCPRGSVVRVNPIQVCAVAGVEGDPDKTTLLFSAGEWVVFGNERLVVEVLAGNHRAIEEYDKKWVNPAKKEGPRRVASPTSGGIIIGGKEDVG